jgi:hypothetical protein
MSLQPIFIFSLPRSGSTLVQHVLAASDQVCTAPEPWLLLPYLYSLRTSGHCAEYDEGPAVMALREFVEAMPNGLDDYRAELSAFITRLYERVAGPGATYFVDKTPRYYFVIDDLIDLFPQAKFIFLWRNPLAILASIVETWGRGKWSIGRWESDLFVGVDRLVQARRAYRGCSYSVRYEDLLTEPDTSWPDLFAFLDLPFDPEYLTIGDGSRLRGQMGDKGGYYAYGRLSSQPLEKWKSTIANPIRKRKAEGYLRWIGTERLSVMGYDLGELSEELARIPSSLHLAGSDVARGVYGRVEGTRRRLAFEHVTRRGRW